MTLTSELETKLSQLEQNPNNPSLINEIGTILYQLQDLAKAKQFFQKALELSTDDLEIIYNCAVTNEDMGVYNEAVELYERHLLADPINKEIIEKLAGCYFQLEKYEQGSKLYAKLDDNQLVAPMNIVDSNQILVSPVLQLIAVEFKVFQILTELSIKDFPKKKALIVTADDGNIIRMLRNFGLTYQNIHILTPTREDAQRLSNELPWFLSINTFDQSLSPSVSFDIVIIQTNVKQVSVDITSVLASQGVIIGMEGEQSSALSNNINYQKKVDIYQDNIISKEQPLAFKPRYFNIYQKKRSH